MILAIIVLSMACLGIFLTNRYYKKKDEGGIPQTIPDNLQEMINKAASEEKLQEAPVKKKKKYYYHKKK
jgi:uncharacterized BrkB/YihY/UPF0761 family membrane protein